MSFGKITLFVLAPLCAMSADRIVVDAAPSHVVNSFSPLRALGGAIDRLRGGRTQEENEKHTERLLTGPVLKEMLGAGWGTVTYRQNTELMIEAWHWNPRGTWSNAAKQEGYFTGSAEPTNEKILHSWAYPLPHRGATLGDGNGWSRLTDGDLKSYWKSNPYLTKPYTGEDDSLHPQWVMIDLGAKVDVNAIRIAWADPYARRYYVQFWTGEQAPFYDGINKGAWQTFPMGTIADGKGGTPTLKLMSWNIPVRYLRIWMTESSNTCDTHGAAGQAQLRGIRDQRAVRRDRLRRRPVHRRRQAPAQPPADHHLAVLGGPVACGIRSRLRPGRSDRAGFLLQLRRDARPSRDDSGRAALHHPGRCGQRDRVSLQAEVSDLVDRDGRGGGRPARASRGLRHALHPVREGDPQTGARGAAGRSRVRGHAGRRRFVGGRERPGLVPGPLRRLSQGARPSAGLHVLLLRALPVHGRPRPAPSGVRSTGSRRT